MRLRKIINLVFLILMGGFILTSTFADSKQVALSVLYCYTSEAQKASIKQSLEQYEKLHPKIKLNVQFTTVTKWPETIRLRAIGNDYPDVTRCPLQWDGQWAVAGKLLAGNQYIPASVLNKYHKARLASVTFNDGRIYGLPLDNSVRAVLYNVDFFEKAGIKPPQKAEDAWTWEELVAAAQKAQVASGAKYALQFDRLDLGGFLPFIYQAGGQLMSDDLTRPMLDTQPVRKTLKWILKLHQDSIAASGVIEGLEEPRKLFAYGQTTMWLAAGAWMVAALEPMMTKYKFSYTFMPRDAQSATTVGGSNWIAFKGANPRATWDLLLYLVSPESMASYSEAANSVPARSDVHVKWKLHPELASFFAEQAKECPESLVRQQIHPAISACREKLMEEVSMCVSGQQSVEATAAAMDRILGEAMKLYHY